MKTTGSTMKRKAWPFPGILVLIGLLAGGCATGDTTALHNARSAYSQAQANPAVTANAPVTLYEAGQSLQKAEQAGNAAEQRHYAYLAQRQTEQAVSEAEQKQAESRIGQLGQQREQIVLQSREQEAAQARARAQSEAQRAQMSAQQAEMERQQAQTAREQEARARGEAAAAQQQAQMATEQARQLESQMSELKARETNRGVMLTMSDLMFATGQATITPGGMLSLNKLADILKQNPNEKVLIEGHTDNVGGPAYNRELSQRRAEAVRNALVERGISPDRITARGYGEDFPVASNTNAAGRQQNRRVDIVVTG